MKKHCFSRWASQGVGGKKCNALEPIPWWFGCYVVFYAVDGGEIGEPQLSQFKMKMVGENWINQSGFLKNQ